MDNDCETRVRIRAYEIWEREGRLEGGADQHWLRAEEELLAEEAGVDVAADYASQTAAEQGVEDDPSRKPTGTGTVATGTVVDPDLAGTSL